MGFKNARGGGFMLCAPTMLRLYNTIGEVWKEYTTGLHPGDKSIKELNRLYWSKWRKCTP